VTPVTFPRSFLTFSSRALSFRAFCFFERLFLSRSSESGHLDPLSPLSSGCPLAPSPPSASSWCLDFWFACSNFFLRPDRAVKTRIPFPLPPLELPLPLCLRSFHCFRQQSLLFLGEWLQIPSPSSTSPHLATPSSPADFFFGFFRSQFSLLWSSFSCSTTLLPLVLRGDRCISPSLRPLALFARAIFVTRVSVLSVPNYFFFSFLSVLGG